MRESADNEYWSDLEGFGDRLSTFGVQLIAKQVERG